MKRTLYIIALVTIMASQAFAQVATVTFDTDDYTAVGVYDAWLNSPFRTGALTGNAAVIDNPYTGEDDFLGVAPNSTAKVLAVQRSRYGSNQFGARVDLPTPFSLSPETQYVHVMIYRPVTGRVMLMGLGKHRESEWAGQSQETEQFWVISSNTVVAGHWADAVFPIKGVSGVDIYSLVVVPECESPHERTEDFIAYIDQIEVNSSSMPIVQYEDYPVNFSKDNTHASRTDRGILSVGLQNVQTVSITSSPSTSDMLYRNRMDVAIPVTPGQSLTPVFGYQGSWMCGYAYVDYGQDGKLSFNINDDATPGDGSDLVSYSAYNQKNSAGTSLSNNNTLNMPAFTVPASTPYGFYCMRFKVDWNSIDPAGSSTIQADGGGVVDVRLNVHGDNVSVIEDNRNGEILSGDGTSLPASVPFGEALTIKLNPENGFGYNGVRIRHGYNVTGDSLKHSVPQYVDVYVYRDQFDENNCYTIPASLVDGDLLLEGLFVEQGTEIEFNYPINYDKSTKISRTDRGLNGVSMAGTTYTLPSDKYLYHEDMSKTFFATPGESLSATFNYTGSWMNGYVYIDCAQDGDFSYNLNSDGTPGDGSDLLTYSHIEGKNSQGSSVAGNTLNPPAFTLPELSDGFYRLRFKVDWSSADPGGNTSSGNPITNNGGGIADARLRVFSGTKVALTVESSVNGTINTPEGEELPDSVAFHTGIPVIVTPEPGYYIDSLCVVHGDLEGQEIIHSVPQRYKAIYTTDDFYENAFTLPADIVDGDLDIRVVFKEGQYEKTPTTATLRSIDADHGCVRNFDNSALADGVQIPTDQPATILIVPDEGYTLANLRISSSQGIVDVPSTDLNYNRYDIPASMIVAGEEVVASVTFNAMTDPTQDADPQWKYVWGDEFSSVTYAKPDDAKWMTPTRHSGVVWSRFIADADSTSFIKNGYYVARCFANDGSVADNDADMLSGAIKSEGRFSAKYGRIEARMKTHPHKGNFPAFWMLPQNPVGGWPACGEIDIMEQINTEQIAYHTVHSKWANTLGNSENPTRSGKEHVNTSEWHIYALEWDSVQIRWYVDNNQVFQYNKLTDNSEALEQGQWPFDTEFYVILNQSVGNGSWAATPDMSFTYETLFDYVRVYQFDNPGESTSIGSAFTENATRDGYWYDLQGRRITNATKGGVYIRNGRKVIIK